MLNLYGYLLCIKAFVMASSFFLIGLILMQYRDEMSFQPTEISIFYEMGFNFYEKACLRKGFVMIFVDECK